VRYRTLGRTGLQVSALALGTVELGLDYGIAAPGDFGRPDEAEAIRLVHAAIDAGITLIDTARAYGTSEEVLGKALAGRRPAVVLASKARTTDDNGVTLHGESLRRALHQSLDESLRQLQTDYLDLWQLHSIDADLLAQADLVAEVFADERRAGRIRSAGASTYGADLPLAAITAGCFDAIQITYSVLDQRLADRVLPAAAERGVGIVARSILLKGALTQRADHLPERLAPLRDRSRRFRALVAEAGLPLSPVQVAVAFGLAQPQIHAVLVGVRSEWELREDLGALGTALPEGLLAELRGLRLDDADLLNPSTWGIP
jgi:aryl-alcohol dehydrogenase-like predicted oxidoreductase